MRQHWGALIEGYFKRRSSLRGVIVVMDVRHPLTEHDQTMLALAAGQSVPVHIVLTKADKLGRGAGRQAQASVQKAVGPGTTVQLMSALNGDGVGEARGALLRLLAARPEKETPVGPADPTGAS
jgi:GTP-binding protein